LLGGALDAAPYVQADIELTDWQVSAITDMPAEGEALLTSGFAAQLEGQNQQIFRALPLIPQYDPNLARGTVVASTSASSVFYQGVLEPARSATGALPAWAEGHMGRYRELQAHQARQDEVRRLLSALKPARAAELDHAYEECMRGKAGLGHRTSAGIAMRNLLEHVKGDLMERARFHPGENMTWQIMAQRLVAGPQHGSERQALLAQERHWGALHHDLSDVAKAQKRGENLELDDLWTRLLDNLFVTLGLTKL